MQIEVVDTLEALNNLKAAWDDLFQRSEQSLFMEHAWVYNNYRVFTPDNIFLLAVYAERRRLIGIFPFTVKDFKIKGMSCTVLSHGGSSLTDFSSFLVDASSNCRLMINRVIDKLSELQEGRWDYYKIDNLSDGDAVASLFRHLLLRNLYAGEIVTDITPAIRFGYQYEEAKKIANIRRRFNKIDGDEVFEHKVGHEIDSACMQEFSEFHQLAYPGAGFDKPKSQKFFKTLLDDHAFRGKVCMSSIREDGKLMASHFGFSDNNCFYYYVPTYNEEYARYGVGQYLLLTLINKARDDGQREFNLLRGRESYKYNWMNTINNNYTVFAAPLASGWFKKLMVNLWLFNKAVPFFTRKQTD